MSWHMQVINKSIAVTPRKSNLNDPHIIHKSNTVKILRCDRFRLVSAVLKLSTWSMYSHKYTPYIEHMH